MIISSKTNIVCSNKAAIGALVGGPVGAAIFNEIMMKGATKRPDGLLDPDPVQNALGWLILMGIGLASAVGMALYNRWIQKDKTPT